MNNLKLYLLVLLFGLCITDASAGIIDTLYYDVNWKGVDSSFDAEFIRILNLPDDPKMPKSFKDYYNTGELCSKGHFVSIDKYDDNNSVFDGEVFTYYKSGAIKSTTIYKKGFPEGTSFDYSEDGTIKVQYLYENGEISDKYLMYREGECFGEYDQKTSRPITKVPQESDIKNTLFNSLSLKSYLINGIKISCAEEDVKDYGKYHRFHFFLTNMTNSPIDLRLNDICVYSVKKNKKTQIKVLSRDEYLKRIDSKTKLSKWYHNANERYNAQQAGNVSVSIKESNSYTSTTTTNSAARAYGSDGSSAYGYGSSSNNTTGKSNTSSNVTFRDEGAAYEAQQIATRNINEYNNQLEQKKRSRADNYWTDELLKPFGTKRGYVNAEKSNGELLVLEIDIDGVKYPFNFNLTDDQDE